MYTPNAAAVAAAAAAAAAAAVHNLVPIHPNRTTELKQSKNKINKNK